MISTIKTQIILASTSVTRRKILESYDIKATYVKHTVDEDREIMNYKERKRGLAKYLEKKKNRINREKIQRMSHYWFRSNYIMQKRLGK